MEDEQRRQQSQNALQSAASSYLKRRLASAVIRGLMATSEVWGPIAAATGLVVLFVVIIMVGFGGQATGTETSSSPLPTNAVAQDISGILKISGATDAETKTINDALSIALAYPGYRKLISNGPLINVLFEPNLEYNGNCVHGLVENSSLIRIRSTNGDGNNCGFTIGKLKYTIFHESGHIIDGRNPGLNYPYERLYSEDGPNNPKGSCYSFSGYITSYPFAESGLGGEARDESFAESISLFLYPRDPLKDFQTKCPNTYAWFRNNVFRDATQGPLP